MNTPILQQLAETITTRPLIRLSIQVADVLPGLAAGSLLEGLLFGAAPFLLIFYVALSWLFLYRPVVELRQGNASLFAFTRRNDSPKPQNAT